MFILEFIHITTNINHPTDDKFAIKSLVHITKTL